VLNKGLYPFT